MSANNQSGAGSKMDNVSFIEAVNHYWALILAGIGLIVWLVRLEGKVSYAEGNIQAANGRIDTLATKHDSLDSKLVAQLSDVRESLARIEGVFLAPEGPSGSRAPDADQQVGEVGGSQLEVVDDPALGHEQMQLVAKDGLLLRAAMPEGGPGDLPLDARLRHVGELGDGDGQAIDNAVRVLGQVEDLQHRLTQQIDDLRQVAATTIEARAFGLAREEITMLTPAAEQDPSPDPIRNIRPQSPS